MNTTPAPVSSPAITALVLGTVGLLIVIALFGVFKFVGLALAIAALIVGGFAGRRGEEGRTYALIGAG
ncbi:hypothetical protein [Microbacterium testaceum]|uniref:Uncharacterized protein n=1 Tax=Microbacterium testaceum TaxID=2033 RepID=A0A147F569_MICTE|nr:hypothetical protein [Microbacterium testaceum]KTS09020.1 hypothetical protein RSA3_14040 [Microbacterium testaceum]